MECEEGAVRLVGGVNKSSGILEVCTNGVWGRVCNALQYWGSENAKVVCRQLGFLEEGKNFYRTSVNVATCMEYIPSLIRCISFVIKPLWTKQWTFSYREN